ncbi:hypothetical protein D6D23_02665 [Aureobasidium pullulans]|uniref:C2H2-type domain-containing protein n=1 Tax=Aureobasidium pullulans TaxID=5580 RepID=A0A4S8SW79_AURPU|nr:hypothetical protein D6D28_01771 [Aureobasidium pullulans]THW27664.1 hypothetical protein D6D23_02665 [Aureobasidium pullulans]
MISQPATDTSLSALLASQQMNGHPQSMDARQQDYSQQAPLKQEYSQPGLNSPYASSSYTGNLSETLSSPDQNQAAQYHPDVRPSLFSTASSRSADCSRVRQSARSASFPEYQQQPQGQQQQPQRPYPEQGAPRYQQPGGHPHAAMAQSSRSLPLASALRDTRSDSAIAIDPTIAAQNPQYPQQHAYSPYPPQHEMHQYPGQPGAPMYAPRPEWGAYHAQPMHYAPVSAAGGPPGMAAAVPRPPHGGHPMSTVYSFVPIPGAQQHKRPRRRYEEIERMYKCGWNGCEKAYGTLNHLNAHVTMQSHGAKRTPEEFKEIRKEWKAKKKEEENARKQEEERQRQEVGRAAQEAGTPTQPAPAQYPQQHMMPPQAMSSAQLPPIGYAPAAPPTPQQYTPSQQQVDGAQSYPAGQMYATNGGYPQSPYAQGGQIYQQR